MTLEELWASLKPQADAIEFELKLLDQIRTQSMGDACIVGLDYSALEAVYAHAFRNGQAHYTVAVDPALRGTQGICIIMDDAEGIHLLAAKEAGHMLDAQPVRPQEERHDHQTVFIGHPDQLSPTGRLITTREMEIFGRGLKSSMMGAMLEAAMLDCSYLCRVQMEHGPDKPWPSGRGKGPKPNHKHQKNIFRTTMRSVNRNR